MNRNCKLRRAGQTLLMAVAVWMVHGCGSDGDEPVVTVASNGPNAVSYWDEVAATTIMAPASASDATEAERFPNTSIDMPTVHVAMYDAAMAIVGTHQPFLVTPTTPGSDASMEAAVSAAAYGVLKGLFPNRAALYEPKYADALAAIADGPAKAQGLAPGSEVATAVLAARANDGRATLLPAFVPGTEPGKFSGVAAGSRGSARAGGTGACRVRSRRTAG